MISKPDLLARLTEGHAARITVVTPNRRLSQSLVVDFDEFQIRKDLSSWEAADILPFDAFVGRLYEDALYSDIDRELPMLLTPAQEEQLWRRAVEKAGLLAPEEAAALCRKAWGLLHEWRVRSLQGNEDVAAFSAWKNSYEKATKSNIDAARLPDLVGEILEHVRLPKLLVVYAFGVVPPQAKEFFDALAAKGVEIQDCLPEKKSARPARASFRSAKEELEKAAQWARARLENRSQAPISPRIGVVVPDLPKRRKEVVRVFSRVMQPGGAKAPMPFNVSLGLPLIQYPVVALALSVLEFSRQEIPFEKASELIRSPFLNYSTNESSERTKLDARLRRELAATVSLPKLISLLEKKLILRVMLEKLYGLRDDGLFADKIPSDWARHFSELLKAVGFPGERAPDSHEKQTLAKWHETLGELAKLDSVLSSISFRQAFSVLKRLCSETLFQPDTSEAPIQVLEVLESTGMTFDHLWVSGLTDAAWPRRASPNPFLPLAAQRAAGIDEASAEGALERDRRITEGWLAAADEVVLSSFEKEEDRDVAPSPLILAVEKVAVDVPAFPKLRDLIFASRKVVASQDSVGPAVTASQVKGGTKILSDQSACPFRAFAHHRLKAEKLEEPYEGLDNRDRGKLLHELMAALWRSLKESSTLEKDISSEIESAADVAVKELKLEGRFAELERQRLVRLAREWLEVEKNRSAFEVVAVEKEINFQLGGLEFKGRIDRMDRIKEGHVLIDYKTGRNVSGNQWKPPRPEDPQLPIYAVTAKENIAAVAFGRVRPGEMRYHGFSRTKDLIPQVQPSKNWKEQLDGWKEEVETLAKSFAAGEARVDPKKSIQQTCRYCDLHTLCRVYEKANPLREDEQWEGGE